MVIETLNERKKDILDLGARSRRRIMVSAEFRRKVSEGNNVDPAIIAFLLDEHEVCRSEQDFVFWNNMQRPGIAHQNCNPFRGYDYEAFVIEARCLEPHVRKIVFCATTDSSNSPGHTMRSLAAIGVYADPIVGVSVTLGRYEERQFRNTRVLQLACLTKKNRRWRLAGNPTRLPGGLKKVCKGFGIAAIE